MRLKRDLHRPNNYAYAAQTIYELSGFNKSCWICMAKPTSSKYGIPYEGVALNLSLFDDDLFTLPTFSKTTNNPGATFIRAPLLQEHRGTAVIRMRFNITGRMPSPEPNRKEPPCQVIMDHMYVPNNSEMNLQATFRFSFLYGNSSSSWFSTPWHSKLVSSPLCSNPGIPDKCVSLWQWMDKTFPVSVGNANSADFMFGCINASQINATHVLFKNTVWNVASFGKLNLHDSNSPKDWTLQVEDGTYSSMIMVATYYIDAYATLPLNPPFYWLCGKWAYLVIPRTYVGECVLGLIGPSHTIHPYVPSGMRIDLHNTVHRSRRSSISVKTSEAERFSGILLPAYGVARLYSKMNLFVDLVDDLFNHTTHALAVLSAEQRQIRDAVIQNRMALDYLLMKEGGVCGLLNLTHCCFHIDDISGEVSQDIHDIEEIQTQLRKVSSPLDGFDWTFGFSSIFGSLGSTILHGLMYLVMIILVIAIFYKLLMLCLEKCCVSNSPMMPAYPILPPPPTLIPFQRSTLMIND
uniref:Envelope protein n=1 Tax=Leptobrachium leishanense TaxID=445787 RepID=A0A8C5PII0_9ANUR